MLAEQSTRFVMEGCQKANISRASKLPTICPMVRKHSHFSYVPVMTRKTTHCIVHHFLWERQSISTHRLVDKEFSAAETASIEPKADSLNSLVTYTSAFALCSVLYIAGIKGKCFDAWKTYSSREQWVRPRNWEEQKIGRGTNQIWKALLL